MPRHGSRSSPSYLRRLHTQHHEKNCALSRPVRTGMLAPISVQSCVKRARQPSSAGSLRQQVQKPRACHYSQQFPRWTFSPPSQACGHPPCALCSWRQSLFGTQTSAGRLSPFRNCVNALSGHYCILKPSNDLVCGHREVYFSTAPQDVARRSSSELVLLKVASTSSQSRVPR